MKKFNLILLFITILNFSSGFKLSYNRKPITKFKYVGDTKPLGYFDPFKMSQKLDEDELKNLREAELQHGRLAMFSVFTMFNYEVFTQKMSYNLINLKDPTFQQFLLINFVLFEIYRLKKQYNFPSPKKYLDDYYNPSINIFKIKEEVEPGLIFNSSNSQNEDKMNKELNNGRLAMIGICGYLFQEYLGFRVF